MVFKHKVGLTKKLKSKLLSLGAIIVLVAQPMYGVILNTQASALPATIHTNETNLGSWSFAATLSKGHNSLVGNGLRVWTDSNDRFSKAAGYYATPGLTLAEVDAASIEFQSYTGGRPSVQIGVDRNNDGIRDGYLVYEPWSYGQGQFWVNQNNFGVPAGGGYPSMGTLAQYQAANPNAKVTNIGYSLGSGVKGDAVISKIIVGDRTYTFGATPPAAPVGLGFVNSLQTCNGFTNINYAQPKWTSVSNVASYNYRALINGEVVYSANYTASQHPGGAFGGGQNGLWAFQVQSVGTNGLTSEWSAACSLKLDTIKPVATITTSPTDDQTLPANPAITGTVLGSEINIKSHWFEITNPDNTITYENVASASSLSHTFTLDTSKGSGSYKIRYVATDKAGNRSDDPGYSNSTIKTIIVDADKPSIYIKGKANTYAPISSGNFSSDVYREVSFKFYDSQKVVRYVLNGQAVNFTSNTWSDADFGNIKNKLVQGVNTISVYDTSGNSTSMNFTYDTTTPSAVLTYSNNNGNALTNNDVTVTVTGNEDLGDINGWTRVNSNTLSRQFAANGKFSVVVSDIAGNSATANGEVKRIDRNAPTISGISDGQRVRGSVSLIIFDPKFEGYDGYDRINGLVVNGAKVETTETAGKNYTASIVGDGNYTAIATDKAGNSTTISFSIDNSLAMTLLGDEFLTSTPTIEGRIVYSADQLPLTNTEVKVTVNNLQYAATTDENGVWSVSVTTPLSNNSYSVDLEVNGSPYSLGNIIIATPAQPNTGGNNGNQSQNQPQGALQIAQQDTEAAPALVSQPFTNFATFFNNDGTVSAAPAPTADTNTDNGDILGAEDSLAKNAAQAETSKSGYELFGFAWYWILAALAALLAGWWFIAGYKRRKDDKQAQ